MTILEPRSFEVGRFMVVFRQEADMQWLYTVYLGPVRIGKSVSLPDVGCCEFLYRQQRGQTCYAMSSAPLSELSNALHRQIANRKRGRPRSAETIADIAKALAGG